MVPEKWLVLTVAARSAVEAADLAEGLIALGGAAVEEAHGHLTTYVLPPADVDRFVQDARERLTPLAGGAPLELTWRWQADEDWARRWRRGLGPRRVGRRLLVTPSWVRPEPRPEDVVLVIDPEMAFGTAEHATTRGALRLLEAAVRPGDRVLDVGTGSAILAIAAAKLDATRVLAVECDADALENARANIERNGVASRVEPVLGRVDRPYLDALERRFDLIVANVLSGVLVPLLPGFRRALDAPRGAATGPAAAAGRLILGGILDHEAAAVVAAADRAGFRLRVEDVEDEWWSGLFEATAPGDPG